LAQGQGRSGRLERPLVKGRADREAHPRRHGRARSARQEGHVDLASRRTGGTNGRPGGAAGDQEHGWRERGPWRALLDSLEEAGDKLFTFTRFPPHQWKSIRTSNAIERLHEEFKRRIKTQTVLPCAKTAAMLFWAILASGQIVKRKVDGWETLAEKASAQTIVYSSRDHRHARKRKPRAWRRTANG
jgi:hypothetical protein